MLRCLSLILLCALTALATGIPQFLHERQHEQEDALELQQQATSNTPTHHPSHSEQDCPICAQFHAPSTSEKPLIWLIESGVWVRFVSTLRTPDPLSPIPQQFLCRGPPPITSI